MHRSLEAATVARQDLWVVPFPSFLIIGAQKSATRWLRVNLGAHPDVFTAPRELEFFNHQFARGASWYLDQFADWLGEPAVGEATPGYMMWRERPDLIAARIDGFLPGVRLIALLRDPIDRAYSAYIHHVSRGRISAKTTLLEYVQGVAVREDPLGIISGGWYAASLQPYLRRFGNRLLVVFYDDVKRDPRAVYRRVCGHLGVRKDHVPASVEKRRFGGSLPAGAPQAVSDEGHRRALTREERETLKGYFATDIEELKSTLDVDLSHWG